MLNIEEVADKYLGIEHHAITKFADTLDSVPMALVENSGVQPIETLSEVKSWKIKVLTNMANSAHTTSLLYKDINKSLVISV